MRLSLLLAAMATTLSAPAMSALAQTSLAASAFDVPATRSQIDVALDREYPHLDALYKDIHQHAEISFQETRTAALLAGEMRKLGFEVTEHVGKTGIVALYKNGPGPTVMVRTELDALPMEEKTGLPYASREQQPLDGKPTFTDHSCGHDSHMAWWVGTAETLLAMRDRWHGTLMFIGQPAEEVAAGAKAMLDDGLLTRFPKPDVGFAAHVGPAAYGTVTIKQGTVTSASDSVVLTFNGRGAHGSMPSRSLDPIVMGAHFVSDVQTVISREKNPLAFGVITVGAFQSGTVGNIIPDNAVLKLSLRSFDPETRKVLNDGVARVAKDTAAMARAPEPTITYLSSTAMVMNDPALTPRVGAVIQAALGNKVTLAPASDPGGTASEDYSAFIEAGVPSVFFGIGGSDPKALAEAEAKGVPVPVNHSPLFAPIPEPSIRTGVEVLTLAVLSVTHK